jgi:hypothetical protein
MRHAPYPLVALLPGLLVATGVGARVVAERAWRAFVAYETPFAVPRPAAEMRPPLARPVLVVLVDGLGQDASRALPFLNELRARGADVSVRAGVPSLSLPGRAVIASGAWQEVHGQTTNFRPRPLQVDHLFASAHASGLRTGLAAGPNVQAMFGPVDVPVVYPREEPKRVPPDFTRFAAELRDQAAAARRLLAARPHLAWVDLTIMDECGHAWGAASDEYRRAGALIDAEVRALATAVEPGGAAIAVTADHGHVPRGGHGGGEEDALRVPLVLAGAGVRAGARAEARQIDLGPTLAALTGAPFPASGQGRPLVELLTLEGAGRAAVSEAHLAQRRAFAERYLARVAGPDPQTLTVPVSAAAGVDGELARLEAREAAARAWRLDQERRGRAVLALGLLALAAVAFVALRALGAIRRGDAAAAVPWAVLALVAYVGSFRALGLGYSISLMNDDADLEPFLQRGMAAALLSTMLAVILFAARAWRAGRSASESARVAGVIAFLVASAFLAKAAAVFWRQGVFLRWAMPDFWWGFGFYMDVLAITAVGVGAPLVALVAWLVTRRTSPSGA